MAKRWDMNLIPLLVLAACCLYTVYVVLSQPLYVDGTEYARSFDVHHCIGFVVLTLTLGLYWIQKAYFKYAVLLLLGLWLSGISNYLPSSFGIGMGFGEASISLQLVALVFVVAYYIINRERANKKVVELTAVKPDSAKARRIREEEVEQFEQKFQAYSIERLRLIVEEKKLVSNAVEAAQKLLTERIK
ncbi:hypothetical protein [Hymenobacter lucidus]|uniref:Uncharacterized protein n=1 Tax=Hymenobacter lucidus TaxID=2880930 RepID=A0ABS8AZK6_9BACT|nr:hypothetical protein [Hymenobacter lucidus]MCB2411194.1 hypothetical protein [Hymenobacter lucidus]